MNKPPSGNFPPATSRYEDLVRLHQMDVSNIHGNPKFLPWHRYYLWTFEQVLRDECGFNRAFPWWDETLDAGNFAQSELFTNTNYFGHLPPPDANGNGYCIESGAFAGLTCHIGPGGSTTTPHCLARAVDESLTSQCNTGFVNYCNSRTDYADMESCAEGG
jgi:tyrosinase